MHLTGNGLDQQIFFFLIFFLPNDCFASAFTEPKRVSNRGRRNWGGSQLRDALPQRFRSNSSRPILCLCLSLSGVCLKAVDATAENYGAYAACSEELAEEAKIVRGSVIMFHHIQAQMQQQLT